jgi:transitional endoplasmic reticulum ATPase
MTNNDYAEVTVKEAARGDAGRGIARVSIEVMKKLGLVSGDIIEIQAKKKAVAIVWPGFAQDTGFGILRIDGNIRGNAGTGIDEIVKIAKSQASYATKVVIQPTQQTNFREDIWENYLHRALEGVPLFEGQLIRLQVMGNSISVVIAKVSPKGIVLIDEDTEITFKNEPLKTDGAKKETTNIHYEDIGGLGRELQLVREMIELPLRHPEIFERLGIQPPKASCSTVRPVQERP